MAKTKVEVLSAVVDGKGSGSTLEIDEKSAEFLAEIGYVKILGKGANAAEIKAEAEQPKPKKSPAKSKTTKKDKE